MWMNARNACTPAQVYEDPELVKSCDEGLNKQLRRTKDGATEQSRIQELAGGYVCVCVGGGGGDRVVRRPSSFLQSSPAGRS
jgi:hypothetical protein